MTGNDADERKRERSALDDLTLEFTRFQSENAALKERVVKLESANEALTLRMEQQEFSTLPWLSDKANNTIEKVRAAVANHRGPVAKEWANKVAEWADLEDNIYEKCHPYVLREWGKTYHEKHPNLCHFFYFLDDPKNIEDIFKFNEENHERFMKKFGAATGYRCRRS